MVMASKSSKLFEPLKVGAVNLKHRVIMAPLTRCRSPAGIPTDLVGEYYEQRASDGGLLISEATHISVMGGNYTNVPGIYTPEQIRAWKKVTDRVHKKGGIIFCQLWHVGRTTHPLNLGGRLPVAPSAVNANSKVAFTPQGMVDSVTPREMTLEEIQDTISDYAHAAKCAIAAGFDGVEIHGANGYLIDQFICDNINLRNDRYGGSIEKRAQFAIDVTDAVVAAIGADRVGIRFSPFGFFQGTFTSDPVKHYGYVIEQIDPKGLAYIHLIEPRSDLMTSSEVKWERLVGAAKARGLTTEAEINEELSLKAFRKIIKKTPLLGNGTYDEHNVHSLLEANEIDAAVYGRSFISNPDLPARLKLGKPLANYDRSKFYTQDHVGYTDYPTWEEEEKREGIREEKRPRAVQSSNL